MASARQIRAAMAADRSSRAKHRPLKDGHGTGEDLEVMYGPGCWCGGPWPHDWPGKDDGAPHPREIR